MTAPSVSGRRTGLLIYHFTDTLTRPESAAFEQSDVDSLPLYARLLDRCRAAGATVVYVISEREVAIGAQIVPEVAPLPGETEIRHVTGGAFSSGEFRHLLRERGLDTVLITGNAIDRGLSDTARQAREWSIHPIMVRGVCFTHDIPDSPVGPVSKEDIERVHLAALHRHGIEIMTVDEVISALA